LIVEHYDLQKELVILAIQSIHVLRFVRGAGYPERKLQFSLN